MSYTYEETKRWLRRAWFIDEELSTLMRQHYEEYSRLTSITAQLSGMPGSPSKDPHKFDALASMESKIQDRIQELKKTKEEIREVILSVDDDRYRTLLLNYYITDGNGRHKTFEEIADIMHYHPQGIKQMHPKAVECVMCILNYTLDM